MTLFCYYSRFEVWSYCREVVSTWCGLMRSGWLLISSGWVSCVLRLLLWVFGIALGLWRIGFTYSTGCWYRGARCSHSCCTLCIVFIICIIVFVHFIFDCLFSICLLFVCSVLMVLGSWKKFSWVSYSHLCDLPDFLQSSTLEGFLTWHHRLTHCNLPTYRLTHCIIIISKWANLLVTAQQFFCASEHLLFL
jgi:hypothetical protein